jgi:hypothetical protein
MLTLVSSLWWIEKGRTVGGSRPPGSRHGYRLQPNGRIRSEDQKAHLLAQAALSLPPDVKTFDQPAPHSPHETERHAKNRFSADAGKVNTGLSEKCKRTPKVTPPKPCEIRWVLQL